MYSNSGGVTLLQNYKTLIYPFGPKNGPRGAGSPHVALTTCIHLYSQSTQKASHSTPKAFSLDSAPPK